MSICLKVESAEEFFSHPENQAMVPQYLDEMLGKDRTPEMGLQAYVEFKDKNFFQINKNEMPIGFGAYKDEEIAGKKAFSLYEFFVIPEHRDVSQLYEIRRQIILALKILDKALWTCYVDTDDEHKQKAYKKLGFQPMWEEDGLLIMALEMENF